MQSSIIRQHIRTARLSRLSATALAFAVAACTTTGQGTGQTASGKERATFTWKADSATRGTMTAILTDGQSYQGPFFQITQETTSDEIRPLFLGWGGRSGWLGWDDWGPDFDTITHYTGKVLANLQGPGGYMRCMFTLASPSSGMAGGGLGKCQVPSGAVIHAQFSSR